ncbi:MAG: response regulator, partial [Faecalibacterium prausnitzii]|nr:response regulator [Faecalibacterium prausnitzii]
IWCSDLDFSLHAFRLRADYFLLEPVTEAALRQGFRIWLDQKNQAEQHWSDRNKHNKENGL